MLPIRPTIPYSASWASGSHNKSCRPLVGFVINRLGTVRMLNLCFFRTLIYVHLIDTAFTISNNLPPQIATTELKMNLACPEACFQAQSADECLLQLRLAGSTTGFFNSIASVVETICEEYINSTHWHALTQIGLLNSFVTISGLCFLLLFYQVRPQRLF